jgi:uncharacterized protein YigE (DUF2233 family)
MLHFVQHDNQINVALPLQRDARNHVNNLAGIAWIIVAIPLQQHHLCYNTPNPEKRVFTLVKRLTRLHFLLLCIVFAGCGASAPTPTSGPVRPVPTLFPTAVPLPAAPSAVGPSPATPVPDTGWIAGRLGLEVRHLRLVLAPDQPAAALVIVRIDPATVRLRVGYAPDQPRGLRSWFEQQRPLLAINGSFFNQDYRPTALLISDGMASGASYQGFGGMFAVTTDGGVVLRPLRDQPYDPSEPLDQALQSFPMLVFPGGAPADIEDNGQHARRTVIAIDRAGRLLLIVGPTNGFTLRGLAQWLSQSDLEIDRALNLDGGSSTGLYLKDGALEEGIDSFGPLPIVLLCYPIN